MNKPIVTFTSIAALAVAALGGSLYWTKQPEQPAVIAEAAKAPDAAPAVEAEKPKAETEVAVATPQPEAPKVETPAAEAPKAEIPQPEAPKAEAPAVAVVAAPSVILPSFDTVRVESTGDAVIAGRAEPDADVTVKWNGNIVGTTKSNADGSFVLVPAKPLTKGTGALTLEMSKNGAVTQSEGSVIVAVKENAPALVAKVDPDAPTKVLQTGDATATPPKDVQLTSVDYDAAGNIVFSGKAVPGSAVRFYVDNAAVGEGLADASGNWSFNGTSTVSPGTHTLRADAVDATGKVLSRIELPFLREDAATVAASQVAAAEPVTRAVTIEKTPEPAPAVAATEPVAAPVAEVAAAPVVVEEGPKKLVIQPGNSLWKLSREVYGKGRMYTIIYEANRDQLKNPNKIFPGQILTAPKQN
jgi:nucleoid-associated protein YgaU